MRTFGFTRVVLYYEFLSNFDLGKCFGSAKSKSSCLARGGGGGGALFKKISLFVAYTLYSLTGGVRYP